MKPKDQLRFAIEFSQMNLAVVFHRPEAQAAFRQGFIRFFEEEPFIDPEALRVAPNPYWYANWGIEKFSDLQEKVRSFLACVTNEDWKRVGGITYPSLAATATYGFLRWQGRDIPTVMGEADDIFLICLWFLLRGSNSEHVGRCPEPKCAKLFFRPTKRAAYCSPTCSTRARVRRLRAKPLQKTVVKIEEELSKKVRETKGKTKAK
jgi:hypothetical protein